MLIFLNPSNHGCYSQTTAYLNRTSNNLLGRSGVVLLDN